jgi:UPF0716 protein FxsA
MRRLMIIIAILVIVPVVELAVLIAIGQVIGGWLTLLLVLAASALGGWLLSREGGRAWRAFRPLVERRPPGNSATDRLLVFFGGVFMLVPGSSPTSSGSSSSCPDPAAGPRLMVRVAQGRMSSAAWPVFGPRWFVPTTAASPRGLGRARVAETDPRGHRGEIID